MNNKYYNEINKVVTEYENGKSYHVRNIDWAADRVVWCWKWRKISKEQMEELADRITAIFDNDLFVD
jgi:hypothetical protein